MFSYKVCKIFKNTFSYRTPLVTASAPAVTASVFNFKIKFIKCFTIKQLFRNFVVTY